jgi:drug/metabolite transporter (DMT)-like permease
VTNNTFTGGVALAYLLAALTALFWAGNTIIGRAVVEELPPLGFAFWRSFGAFLIIAPFGLGRVWRARAAVIAHWRLLLMLGTLGMTGFAVLVFVALHYTGAVNGSLIQGTQPVIMVVLSWLILGTAIAVRQWIGIVIGLAGLMVIVARGDAQVLLGLTFSIGDPVMWLGVFCHGLFSVLVARRPAELDLIGFLTVAFFVGSVTSLPFHLWEIAEGRAMPLGITMLWGVGYMALFPAVVAQIFWVEAIRRIGPAQAGYFIYLTPVFGTVLAIALLGEAFAWFHGLGIVLIFAGVWLATAARSRRTAEA